MDEMSSRPSKPFWKKLALFAAAFILAAAAMWLGVYFFGRPLRQAQGGQAQGRPAATLESRTAAKTEIKSFVIVVDGDLIAALPSEKEAEKALELTKGIHERKIPNLHTPSAFKEQVLVQKRAVDVNKLFQSADEAARFLTTALEKPLIHIIQPGDRAVKIAQQYNISIDELGELNPGVNLDIITEGDRLIIRKAKFPVTLVSKARIIRTITVTSPPEARKHGISRTGKRTVTSLVTYENGEQVSEEVISQVTTWERPKRAIIKRRTPETSTNSSSGSD